MSLLQTFLEILGLDRTADAPLAQDAPDDLAALRRLCTDLGRERRVLMMERDCFKSELLKMKEPDGTRLYTEKSLAMRARMYDRALRARVKAMRAAS